MTQKVFYSFHYVPDNWRASQVRNIGVLEGNQVLSDNDWEEVTRGGDAAIQRWIDGQMIGKSCSIVLIGANTAGRKWINYEIQKAWNDGKGLVGVYIHHLKNSAGHQSYKGANPFDGFNVAGTSLASIVGAYDPPYWDSTSVYEYIDDNIAGWVEAAISIRNGY